MLHVFYILQSGVYSLESGIWSISTQICLYSKPTQGVGTVSVFTLLVDVLQGFQFPFYEKIFIESAPTLTLTLSLTLSLDS